MPLELDRAAYEVSRFTRRFLGWCQACPRTWWPERVQRKIMMWGNTETTWLWLWAHVKEAGIMLFFFVLLYTWIGVTLWAYWVALTC